MTTEHHRNTDTPSEASQILETLARGPLTLGLLIRAIRRGEHMSQADFARQLRISRSHLCDIEKGRKTIAPKRAARYAKILGYSETQFVRLALQGLVDDAGLDFKVHVQRSA